MSNEVYILTGCRTPIGNLLGQFEKHPAPELGAVVISDAIKRAGVDPKDVHEVIMGNVLTAGLGQNPARQASLGAKLPVSVPAYTINMLCGSGLQSVCLGYRSIRNGDADCVVAGGQENMTRAQHSGYIRNGVKYGNLPLVDTCMQDGLTDAFEKVSMGVTAEHLAKEYSVAREVQDTFSCVSQQKAQVAIEKGYFAKELAPVPDKKGGFITTDEFPKPNTTIDALSKLRPAFDKSGTVTSGNASGINDGAAALVLASAKFVKEKGLKPMVRIVATAQTGIEPMTMGLGPISAVKKVLLKAAWSLDDVDLFELNEAFAVQSIIVNNELKLDPSKVNVCGGAIALGHPIGASGARVLVTLIHNMERLGKNKGVASLCIGGGMGIAIAVEKC